ncbi:fungal-specific transcription factor domain-containing protein [Aspergillus keveii]|uniref:Fungal-specific transcription factor domain-containing protein n=1 Tax=Aspergillus keveii TaxID=714993 RepID=A0ABR4GJD8_9EURO
MTPKAPAATISSKNSGNTREADTRTSNKSIPGDAILRRLAYLEEQLRSLQPVIDAPRTVLDSGTSASLKQANKEMDSSTQGSTEVPSSRPSQQTWLQPDTPPSTFEGESSIAHTLTELEDRLEHEGVTFKKVPTNPSSLPLTPASSSPDDDHARGNALDHIRSILCSHGVTSNGSQWDGYLQTFLNEVHVLYPFLYPSTLHERYLGIWRYLDGRVIERTQDDHRAPAAQVLLCLALGRCETGSRSQTADVRHAAGWSLYSAASDLMGDSISIFTRGWNTLLVLQNLVLMIAYLFRLDANDRASKLVALAVSQSHQLGLHRERVLSRMPPFEGEMFRRLWWCLYVLDRRVALETGSPYLIQDFNVDTRFPSELTNDRLSHPSRHLGLRNNHEVDGQAETFTGPDSLIPYLVGMIYYSRTVANVWEVLYKARGSDPQEGGWNPVPHDHLDFLISNAERQMPSALSGDLRVTTAVTDVWVLGKPARQRQPRL